MLKKLLRSLLYFILVVLIGGNLFIVLTGRYYLYSGIAKTYLIGKTGPTIYDLDVFPKATIETSDKSFQWKEHKKFNKASFTTNEEKFHKKWKTQAFLVFQNDTLLFEKYWGTHNRETVSNSFSAGKTVISLLIGIAIEKGHIKSVEEPVGNYIPEFKENGRDKVTIRHLLLMAAGFDWEESGVNPLSETAEAHYTDDLYGLVTRQKVVVKPGTILNYQSGDTQILAFVLKKATGKTIAELTEDWLWKPMGAGQTAYWSLDKENGDEKAYCCLYASPRDFALLGFLMLNQGKIGSKQIVPEWYMQEMVKTPPIQTEEGIVNTRYGYQMWVYPNFGNTVHYYRGLGGQYIMVMPKTGRMVVRLGHRKTPNYLIPKAKKDDKEFCKVNDQRVGHSWDIFYYLAMGERIANKIKK
jgi:CubicO group peptidase (beta-lactamase class C family)